MSRPRRILLLPCLALFAALLLAAPAAALPVFAGADLGWSRFLEPLFRLGRLFAPQGWSIDPDGQPAPEPGTVPAGAGPAGLFAPEGWATDPNGRVAPPPSSQGWATDPNG